MKDIIDRRMEILNRLGGLPEPEVRHQEWLYILKEETRNSILIEGVFISEEELEKALVAGRALERSQQEALNYYRAARFSYGLAYENYRSDELLFGVPLIRQISKMIANKGQYRVGDARIAGARIVPPPGLMVEDWAFFFEKYAKEGFAARDFIRFIAQQHVLFETIHPFDDGNGRTGRILMNYFLICRGYPPAILKGDDKNRKKYYEALERADNPLRKLTQKSFDCGEVERGLAKMKTDALEDLIRSSLRANIDLIIARMLEEEGKLELKPAKEVAKTLGYTQDSMRTLIKRGKFIGVKKGKEWMTHEELLLK